MKIITINHFGDCSKNNYHNMEVENPAYHLDVPLEVSING